MEMLNEIQQANPKATMLIEKWNDRVKLVEDVMDNQMPYERQYTLAACLENTQLAIDLLETTQSTDVGTFKKFALDLITAVFGNAAFRSNPVH